MKIRIFILLSLTFIAQIGAAQTSRIVNFDELMQSLNSGENVRIVVHFALCKWPENHENQSPIPDAVSGMNIDTYEYFAPGAAHNKTAFVVFSQAKLIQNPIGKGFVYNYGKVRINADNSVTVSAKYVHPKNFKVVMDETFIGKLNNGKNGEGINLFK